MKISMIASATIIGVMMTINAYGGSSLDEINNIQNQNQNQIKELEEASKDGFLDKFQQKKEQLKKEAENAKTAAENAKTAAENAKTAAENAKTAAENAKTAAENAKTAAENAKQAKTAAENAKNKAEEQRKEAETKAFGNNGKTKMLNDKIKDLETNNILKDIIKQTNKDDFKDLNQNSIENFKEMNFEDKELLELLEDQKGEKNVNKVLIIKKLFDIGIIKKEKYHLYNDELQNSDPETTGNKELSEQRAKKLNEKLKSIIGEDNNKGLRKLYAIIKEIGKDNLVQELSEAVNAIANFNKKEQDFNKKEQDFNKKEQDFNKKEQDFNEKQKKLTQKEKLAQKAQKAQEEAQKQAEKALQELQPKLEQAEKELKQAQELAEKAKNPEAKAKIIAELDEKLEKAKKDRAEAISSDKNLELNKDEAQTTSSLLSVVNNKEIDNLLLNVKAKDIATLAKNINSTLEEVSKEFKDNKTVDTLLSSVGSATNSRLAKLSNPLNDDLALAYAIKNLSDNKFADNADTLSSVVKEYTNRFNYDSNLWGNIMGGKAKLKSQANTNTYGFMLGYDKAFDNMIIGGYAGYTNAKSSSNTLTTKSDNYHFGAYTRMYIDQNEIDAKVSYGKGKNKLDRKVIIDPDFDANGKYNTKFFDASIDYGHIFDTNNNSFMKPMIGLEYSHVSTKGFKETGKVPVSFKGTTVKTLSAKAAVEFRKYIANGNFLYITPGIQKELRKSMKDTELAFVNSTENIKYASKKDKHTFFILKTGAEMKLTDNLSTNINFGVKAKSESKYYNGTVGLSYKF
ncbi:autotransporter domain protein [Campylobacter pinnipediorum subsp. caledonicus]|uniref:autotransporter outer membrane beta-barrel domain-containing protein n=1 Tax=Campylobacter pinnipediorum TaxID=1965231 RepID=UPI000995D176|nr:autotransporter outer membrane beta-barrel domain-containing protein [Campylobacter pinnipediorum]AQW85272.1 autotransporter domain protein [Campylobacter pinnipediorum subsp. caledonicus]